MAGKFKPGPARGQRFGGRKKGTPNRLTSDVKAMVLGALQAKGGQAWLEKQMEAYPTAFMSLLGRVLPMQVNATFKNDARDLSDAELLRIAGSIGEETHVLADEARSVH